MQESLSSHGARFLLHAASIVVVIAGLRAAGPLLLPLFLAIFLSILSSPLQRGLLDRGFPKLLAVLTTVLTNLAVFALLISLVSGSITALTRSLPRYQTALEGKVAEGLAWLESRGFDTRDLAWLGGFNETLLPDANGIEGAPEVSGPRFNIGAVIDVVAGTLRGVAAALSYFLIVVLLMIFILFEAPGLPRKLERAFKWKEPQVARLYKARDEIHTYLGIKTLISLATGAVIAVWVGVLGVDYPLLWGLVAFLLNYIPSLGSIIAALPPVLLTVVDLGPGRALVVGMGFLVVNIVLGNFAEPHLMGRKFGLSTLVVFLSLVFWGWLWGPVGMLLSVPLTMMLKIMFENSPDLRWLAVLLGPDPRT